jgi:hypothetical protein
LKDGGRSRNNARNERALRRATIVEKWWHGKVKKAAKQSEVLQKELRSRGTNKGRKEELRKVRRQERLASLRLQ